MKTRLVPELLMVVLLTTAAAGFAQQELPEKMVTIDAKDADVRDVIYELFEATGRYYTIAADVRGPVTISFEDVPWSVALKSVCKTADLVYRLDGGIYMISRKPGYNPWTQMVNLEFRDTPLPGALDALFKHTPINYTVDSALSKLKVTAIMRNVTLERALSELAKAAHIAYKIDDNMVTVNALWSSPEEKQPTQIDQPGGLVTEVIQLKYLDPGEVGPLVMKPGLEVSSITGGKLLLRGSAADVAEAKKLVSALDTENALPRVINVKLTIKDYRSNLLNPIITKLDLGAVEGQPAHAELTDKPTSLPSRPADISPFNASLTPTVNDKGEICLTGDMSFQWRLAGDPGASDLLYGKSISISRCLQPGKEEMIAEFARTDPEGRTSKLEVSAVAQLGQGRVRLPHPTVGGYRGYGGGYRVRPPSWATRQPGEPSKQPQPGAQHAGPPPTGVQAD